MTKSNSWEEVSNKLIRTYYFENYDGVADFINKVMVLSGKHKLHPDIIINNDYVKLCLYDEKQGIVTEKCHKLATVIDRIV